MDYMVQCGYKAGRTVGDDRMSAATDTLGDRAATASRRTARVQDPEGTRRNILEIATDEFADKGFSGARVDDIAARTNTSKRMIYYYFGDKEGLFAEVLEQAYSRIRQIEATLNLDQIEPES